MQAVGGCRRTAMMHRPGRRGIRRMRIQVRSLWLVALMRWQTLAWVTPFALEAKGEQMAHLAVHHSDVDHHHRDGASLTAPPRVLRRQRPPLSPRRGACMCRICLICVGIEGDGEGDCGGPTSACCGCGCGSGLAVCYRLVVFVRVGALNVLSAPLRSHSNAGLRRGPLASNDAMARLPLSAKSGRSVNRSWQPTR